MDNSFEIAPRETEADDSSVGNVFLQSAVDSAFVQPTRAIAQITDKVCGTKWEAGLPVISEPSVNEAFGSAIWHAKTIGNAIGTLIPLMITSAGVKRIAGSVPMQRLSFAGLKSSQSLLGLRLSEAATVGFLNDAVFKPTLPSEQDSGILKQRLISGCEGAFNFALMTGTSLAMEKAASAKFAEQWGIARGLRQPIINSIASSTPAAVIGAELHAMRTFGSLTDASDLSRALYSNAVAGAAFGAKHMIQSRLPKAKTELGEHSNVEETIVPIEPSKKLEPDHREGPILETKAIVDEITMDEAKAYFEAEHAAHRGVNGVRDKTALQAVAQRQDSLSNRGLTSKTLMEILESKGKIPNEDSWNTMLRRATLASQALQTIKTPGDSTSGAAINLDQARALIFLRKNGTRQTNIDASDFLKNQGLSTTTISLISGYSESSLIDGQPTTLTDSKLDSLLMTGKLVTTLTTPIEGLTGSRILEAGGFKNDAEVVAFASMINRNPYTSAKIGQLPTAVVASLAEVSRGGGDSDSAVATLIATDPRARTFSEAWRFLNEETKTDQASKPDRITLQEARALYTLWSMAAPDCERFSNLLSERGLASRWLICRRNEYSDSTAESLKQQSIRAERFAASFRSLQAPEIKTAILGSDSPADPQFGPVPLSSTDFDALKLIANEKQPNLKSEALELIAQRGPAEDWMVGSIFKFASSYSTESDVLTRLHRAYYLKKAFVSTGRAEKSVCDMEMFGMASNIPFSNQGEMKNFAHLYPRFPEREFKLSDLRIDYSIVNKMAQIPVIADAPTDVLLPVHDHLRAVGGEVASNHFDGRNVQACAGMWTLEPSMPPHLAEEASALSPVKQFASAVAWLQSGDNGLTRAIEPDAALTHSAIDKAEVRETSYRSLLEGALATTRTENIARLRFPGALPRAIETIHGTLDPCTKVALLDGIKEEADPFRILVGIRGANFRDAYSLLKEDSTRVGLAWQEKAAAALASTFKGAFRDWLNLQSKLGRDLYAASHWLPATPKDDLTGLSMLLIGNAGKKPEYLERVAKGWVTLPESLRSSSFEEIDSWILANRYPNHKSESFAVEAGQWDVARDEYSGYENRFLQSQETPVPFPTDKSWKAGDFTGRFLRRDDPRGVFLGEHTNCCQHPNGAGATCSWFGQESPKSGFFVVEDANNEIVAQSWVWISDKNHVVFDSIEAKGLGDKRIDPVSSIYQQSANDLAMKHGSVSLGYNEHAPILSKWSNSPKIPLPKSYKGYSDAVHFQLIAMGTAAAAQLQTKHPR